MIFKVLDTKESWVSYKAYLSKEKYFHTFIHIAIIIVTYNNNSYLPFISSLFKGMKQINK